MSDEATVIVPGTAATAPSENGTDQAEDIEVLYTHRKPRKVFIEDTKTGHRGLYEIREMEDDAFAGWLKESGKRFQYVDGKPVKQKFEGMHASLIARCLHQLPGGGRVPKKLIDGWGTALKQKLAAMCTEHNGLSRSAEDEEGKD